MLPERRGLCSGSAENGSLVRPVVWLLIATAVWLLLASSFAAPVFAADRIASVEYSKGAVSAVDPEGNPRLLGRGSDLFTGDLIATASQSFAIVKFEDGTMMTLRPDTEFRVDNFQPEKGSGQALFKLLKGGFRVLTGFISKSSNGVFRVDTPVATIGVRGTEFDARLCSSEACADGGQADSADIANAVAVIAQMRGTVAIVRGDTEQPAIVGTGFATGTSVKTTASSWALLVFRDGSRVTVEPNSLFEIQRFNYDPQQARENSFIVRLVSGGLRVLTGAIAGLNPAAYRVETASSNIGVRGSGFDLTAGTSVAVSVWDDCVDFSSATGTLPVCADQQAVQDAPDTVPQLSDTVPSALRGMSGPRPDQVDVEPQQQLLASAEPRLYVSVTEGRVDLANEGSSVVLGPSQNAVALPEGEIQIIEDIPDSMRNDAMPKPGDINDRLLGLFDLVQGGLSRDANARARASSSAEGEDNSGSESASGSDEQSSDAGSGDESSGELASVEDSGSETSSGDVKEDLIPLECAVQ